MKLLLKLTSIISLFIFTNLNALSVEEVLKENIQNVSKVVKTKIIISKKELIFVKKEAKVALKTRLYRMYKVKNQEKILGYGILITRKVRTKKATALYYINTKGILEFTQILAFLEPPEFKPNKKWMTQFQNVEPKRVLKLGRDIPTISGATLSARNVAQGARIARAIFKVKYQ